eukprot:TRINITY_DN5956_c0_g1_i4.p1 TRINITY_DN5956_c0_g1~~TRINITY_DN5956_c0_g1_i4.p1  ORF type:complete len:141 (-),score=31.53 TRINITY_DN5956_c0_g1_i4:90-512(-)
MKVLVLVLMSLVAVAIANIKLEECEEFLKTITTIKNTRYFMAPSKEEVERTQKRYDAAKSAYEKNGCEELLRETEKASNCRRTGCSGQICASEDIVSTCEWREEYACFRHAICGRFGKEESNECQFLYNPTYYECLEKGQ